ncbi:phosphorylase b kinase gamma catalytic chain, skeletal muscle/heart isoform-like isoform X1 [Tachypleus tridentatus]|uniref:phosphorylase b kinase gamma catalytic chain, skeletal muscle/heart isoform-like isoform X1 n=1 Tax=Tachypleus tridentatus TaxID=6853 RepID=UPI003FD0CF33
MCRVSLLNTSDVRRRPSSSIAISDAVVTHQNNAYITTNSSCNKNKNQQDGEFHSKLEVLITLTVSDCCGQLDCFVPKVLRTSSYENLYKLNKEVDMNQQQIMLNNMKEWSYKFNCQEWDDIMECLKNLIQKMLTVAPQQMLTVSEAPSQELLKSITPRRTFNAKKTFQLGILCVRAVVYFKNLKKSTLNSLTVELLRSDPYKIKQLRQMIDGCAYQVYSHWLKKDKTQSQVSLFETRPKKSLQ